MSDDPKQKMIQSARTMLATRGLQGASFSEVLEHSGAPRGSVYHHFPGGKNQLVLAAMTYASERALRFLDERAPSTAREVTEAFIDLWREVLTRSNLEAGCSVVAVAVAADAPELLASAGAIFQEWRGRLARLLQRGGLRKGDATRFAAMLLSACEGAVAISRAEKSPEPYELTATMLLAQVEHLGAQARAPRGTARARPPRRRP